MKLIDDVEFLLVFGTFMAGILIAFIILIVILYRRSQLKMQLERQNFQQSLLETEVEIQEQTLHNISRDLHDNFGQIASLIKINLNLLSKDLPELDRNRISESKDLLSKLIGDIRVLSSSLAAENLEKQGLAKRIESDLDRVKRTGAIEVNYNTNFKEDLMKPDSKVFLYRIFQEILNNALKHSQASKFEVDLKTEQGAFSLHFKDNGVGISTQKLENPQRGLSGNGLLNMRERCKILGADLRINSKADIGTSISITIPSK